MASTSLMKSLVIAAAPIFKSAGWSQSQLKKTSAVWQVCSRICLLQVSLDDSKHHAGTVLQFSANVILDVWKNDFVVEDDLSLPYFRITGGRRNDLDFPKTTVMTEPAISRMARILPHTSQINCRSWSIAISIFPACFR